MWAGMRGALTTIAAAQTLPADARHRSLLVLAATLVAVGTLLIRGGSLAWLAERLHLTGQSDDSDPVQWDALQRELDLAALESLNDDEAVGRYPADLVEKVRSRAAHFNRSRPGVPAHQSTDPEVTTPFLKLRLRRQRQELIRIRDLGTYPSGMLDAALAQLDADARSGSN